MGKSRGEITACCKREREFDYEIERERERREGEENGEISAKAQKRKFSAGSLEIFSRRRGGGGGGGGALIKLYGTYPGRWEIHEFSRSGVPRVAREQILSFAERFQSRSSQSTGTPYV